MKLGRWLLTPFGFRWVRCLLDGGRSKHLWNVSQFLPDYTAQYPRSHHHTRRRENLKSHHVLLQFSNSITVETECFQCWCYSSGVWRSVDSNYLPTFRRNILSPSSGLLMETVFFQNISIYLRVYKASQLRRTSLSFPLWERQISRIFSTLESLFLFSLLFRARFPFTSEAWLCKNSPQIPVVYLHCRSHAYPSSRGPV
jgi:hypothetical protein